MPFVIDGHNLLYSIPDVDEESESVTDVELCRFVGRYLKLINQTGQIIFDGIGPRDKSPYDNIDGVEVFFAGYGTDTDTVIETRITANTAPKSLTIVSSDRRLKKAALARRAKAKKSEDFWLEMQKQLSRKRPKRTKEPPAKSQGLSQSETDQWLDIFGLEQ